MFTHGTISIPVAVQSYWMSCKISISGTFSSGKTTLSHGICSTVKDATLIPEHAGEIKTLFPTIDWRSQIVRDYMLFSQLVREASRKANEHLVVCDTGILESIAHSIVFDLEPRLGFVDEFNHHRYDFVFICDYKFIPIIDNRVRETDPELRARLHDAIIQVADYLRYEPTVLSGSPEQRVFEVLATIRQ